ncbi:MAG: phosphonoacetaldehyde hydrolase [Pirellulales bacterium]|nr:phosphonoacetaldehyde hydrolase [Pirellulales bacterium]
MSGSTYRGPIRMVVFDWAGTTVDHGCFAPVVPFIEAFRRFDVEVTVPEARRPMGLGKKDHVRAIITSPEIAERWQKVHQRAATEEDVEAIYSRHFVPLQLASVESSSGLVPGLLDCVAALRQRGIKIATSTGYFREAAELCYAAAAKQGYQPDLNLCPSDVKAGRPAPWMIYRAMETFDIYPPTAVVKIGDTLPDIEEGRNAGVWTIGVTRTGSDIGLTEDEAAMLPADELQQRMNAVAVTLLAAGAHWVLDSVANLPALLPTIEDAIAAGATP